MKHKKTLVAILLCIVLIFGLFALVACGETDGGNNGGNNADTGYTNAIFEGYSPTVIADFEDLLHKFMSYGAKTYSSFFEIYAYFFGKTTSADPSAAGAPYMSYIFFNLDTDSDDETSCIAYIADNREDLKSLFDPESIVSYKSLFISYSTYTDEENVLNFNDVVSCEDESFNIATEAEKSFINETMNTFLYSEKSYSVISFSGMIYDNANSHYYYTPEPVTGIYFELELSSSTENSFESYHCFSESVKVFHSNLIDDWENENYTEDSYLKLENGTYYAYLKKNLTDEN